MDSLNIFVGVKMKKLIVLSICLCMLLTSCSSTNRLIYSEVNFWSIVFRGDDYVCCTVLEKIVKSIETKDTELLLSLFSENTKAECPDLDKQAEALLNYCSGRMLSYGKFRGLPVSSVHMDGEGNYQESHEPSYDINTTDGSYRITFRYTEIDTIDRANEGILSLYVIKAEDDIDTTYLYSGDGKYTPGIHLGITYEGFDYE